MARNIAQLVVAGVQVLGRAFIKALRQEVAASQAAAARAGGGVRGEEHSATNQKLGLSLEESKQILNITELDQERIQKNYEYLFNVNEKDKGGSFYIQSKVVRAKERIDIEMESLENAQKAKEQRQDNRESSNT